MMLASSASSSPALPSPTLDILAARRCFSKIDSGSTGYVSAHDLDQYLKKFLAQQKRNGDALTLQKSNSTSSNRGEEDDSKEMVQFSSSASAHAASSNSYPARPLCAEVAQVSSADLDDLIRFAGSNGKIDLDEFMLAFTCFNTPTVELCDKRFESEIIDKGVEGARPPPMPALSKHSSYQQQLLPTSSTAAAAATSTSFVNHELLGTGAVLGLTPMAATATTSTTTKSSSPTSSAVPLLSDIFITAPQPQKASILDQPIDDDWMMKPMQPTATSAAKSPSKEEEAHPDSVMEH